MNIVYTTKVIKNRKDHFELKTLDPEVDYKIR